MEETKRKIQEWLYEIDQVEDSQNFDDIKEIELLESFIQEIIFDYCVAKKYEVEGFPFIQFEKMENEEAGYDEDYFTHERVSHYLHRLALKKEDVFSLCSLPLKKQYPELTLEEQRNLIRDFLFMDEQENIQFELTEDEIEQVSRDVKLHRPRLP